MGLSDIILKLSDITLEYDITLELSDVTFLIAIKIKRRPNNYMHISGIEPSSVTTHDLV